jgi:hypothetical protein
LSDPACTPGTHEFKTAAAKVRNVLEAYKAKTKQHLESGVSTERCSRTAGGIPLCSSNVMTARGSCSVFVGGLHLCSGQSRGCHIQQCRATFSEKSGAGYAYK